MTLLANHPVEVYRGKDICELCLEPPDLVKTTLPNKVALDSRFDLFVGSMGRSTFK